MTSYATRKANADRRKMLKEKFLKDLKETLKAGDTLFFRQVKDGDTTRYYTILRPSTNDVTAELFINDVTKQVGFAIGYMVVESPERNYLRVNGTGYSGMQDITDTLSAALGIKLRYSTY